MVSSNITGSTSVSKSELAMREATTLEYHIVVGIKAMEIEDFKKKVKTEYSNKLKKHNYISHGITNPNNEVKKRFNDGVVLKEDYLYSSITKIKSQTELFEKIDQIIFSIQRKLGKFLSDKRFSEVHVHVFIIGVSLDKLFTDIFHIITNESTDSSDIKNKINKLLSSSTYIKGCVKDIRVECIQCLETIEELPIEEEANLVTATSIIKKNKASFSGNIHEPQPLDFKVGIYMCQYGYECINMKDGEGTYSITKTYIEKKLKELGGWQQIQQGSEFDIFTNNNPEIWRDMICDASGFYSQLFHTKRDGTDIYAFCTSGTQMLSIKDWFSNFSQGLIGLAPQYTRSVQIAKKLDKIVGDTKVLFFVGHSLGGGLASNNALITDKRHAITYNAAGLNFMRVQATLLLNNDVKSHQWLFKVKKRKEKIHPFIIRGEVLNSVLSVINERAYGADPQVIRLQQDSERSFLDKLNVFATCYNSLKKHGATNFFECKDEKGDTVIDTLRIKKD